MGKDFDLDKMPEEVTVPRELFERLENLLSEDEIEGISSMMERFNEKKRWRDRVIREFLKGDWEYIVIDIVKSEKLDLHNINVKKFVAAYTKRINGMEKNGIKLTAPMRRAEKVLLEMVSRGEKED